MTKARDLANASTALSAVSATELAFVDGVTSAIQTQIDAKAPSSTAATLTGTQTLTNKTLTSPALTTPTISTATTNGDILYGTGSGALARLGIGTTGQVLNVSGGVPAWATPAGGSFVGSTCTISSSIAIPAATWTQITWANELFDQGSIHASSSGDFVTNATGYWLVCGNIQWDVSSGTWTQVYVNKRSGATDSQVVGSTRFDSTGYITLAYSVIVSCTSGDKLSVYAYQNAGGSRNIQGGGEPKSYISVSYLGA